MIVPFSFKNMPSEFLPNWKNETSFKRLAGEGKWSTHFSDFDFDAYKYVTFSFAFKQPNGYPLFVKDPFEKGLIVFKKGNKFALVMELGDPDSCGCPYFCPTIRIQFYDKGS